MPDNNDNLPSNWDLLDPLKQNHIRLTLKLIFSHKYRFIRYNSGAYLSKQIFSHRVNKSGSGGLLSLLEFQKIHFFGFGKNVYRSYRN